HLRSTPFPYTTLFRSFNFSLLTSVVERAWILISELNHGWPHAADRRPLVSIGGAVPASIASSMSRIASSCSVTTRCCVTTCDSRSEEHTSELQSPYDL